MKTLISFAEARHIDTITQEQHHIPSIVLMEHAGKACATMLKKKMKVKKDTHMVVLCGSGNNGGDGQVIARQFYDWGYTVSVILVETPKTNEAMLELQIIRSMGMSIYDGAYATLLQTLEESDWIIDGLVGIGLQSPYRNAEIIRQANESKARICSIDVPSGLLEHDNYIQHSDTHKPLIHADITLCIGLEKTAMYMVEQRESCGEIICIEGVFPTCVIAQAHTNASVYRMDTADIDALLPLVSNNIYKHKRGVLAIAGGSERSPGALVLSVQSACKGPAGIVYALFDDTLQERIAGSIPQAVSGASIDTITPLHCILAGPGWNGAEYYAPLTSYYQKGTPLVCDAESLRLIAKNSDDIIALNKKTQQKQQNTPERTHTPRQIFTPHIGELKALYQGIPQSYKTHYDTDKHEEEQQASNPYWWDMAQCIAEYYDAIVCAKHSITYICIPHAPPILIEGRNPLLAVAGSGDVLAGLIGSIVSFVSAVGQDTNNNPSYTSIQHIGDTLFHPYTNTHTDTPIALLYATVFGVLLHIQAGNNCKEKNTATSIMDIIANIPAVFQVVGNAGH